MRYVFILEDYEVYQSNVVTPEDLDTTQDGYYIKHLIDVELMSEWDGTNWKPIQTLNELQST